MSYDLEPVAGNWYRHADKGQLFRVVTIDEDRDVIAIQHFDGDLEEVDSSAWFEMDLEAAEEPEDWTGPVDDVETDDLDYTETDMTAKDWREPLQENPRGRKEWEEEDDEEDEDDDDDDDDDDDWDDERDENY